MLTALKIALLSVTGVVAILLVSDDALSGTIRPAEGADTPLLGGGAVARFEQALANIVKGAGDEAALPPLARAALQSEPLDAEAVMFATPVHTDPAAHATHRLALAETVNKRSLSVQLGLIEAAVAAGNIGQALIHYDRAMVAHQQSVDIFFPVLKSAVESAEVRDGLVPYIRAGRSWTPPFLQYLLDNVPPQTVAALFSEFGGGRTVKRVRPLERTLLARLVASGRLADARRYATTMRANRAAGLSSLGVNPTSADPAFGPLAWEPADSNVDTSIQSGQIVLAVPPGASGVVATRVMVVPPGDWQLSYLMTAEGDPPARLVWDAKCMVGSGEERIWSETASVAPGRNPRRATIAIPARCQAVRFELRVDGSELQLDSSLKLSNISIERP